MYTDRALKINNQGQVTIPLEIRKILGTNNIKIEVDNNNIIKILPLHDVGGSLTKYAKNLKSQDFNTIRTDAWEKNIKNNWNIENNEKNDN